jgi:hypothetical protein
VAERWYSGTLAPIVIAELHLKCTSRVLCAIIPSPPPNIPCTPEMSVLRKADKDVISQAELRKGEELMTGTSSAVRLVRELYMCVLERRLADCALIEPGPLTFDSHVGVVCRRKDAGTEARMDAARLHWPSG